MLQLLLEERIKCIRQRFAADVQLFEQTASFRSRSHELSMHTCIGPEWPGGKAANEDAIVAASLGTSACISWACAIADGVSASMYAEIGSRLAVWSARETLVANAEMRSQSRLAHSCFCSARDALVDFADVLRNDVNDNAYKPGYFQAATYRYVINELRFFQTTLCLIWCRGSFIYVASLGDAGAIRATPRRPCVSLFFPNLDIQKVNALWPSNSVPIEIDHFIKINARRSTLAVFTDGVAKGMTEATGYRLSKDFRLFEHFAGVSVPDYLEVLSRKTSEESADNMTLLLVSPI